MFRDDSFVRPKRLSMVLTAVLSAAIFLGSQVSPVVGYMLGLMGMLSILVASFTDSFWPTKRQAEKVIVFASFWGFMIGGVLPFLITIAFQDGFGAMLQRLLA